MSSDYHEYTPLGWPVKKAVLGLLGLPNDATKDEYVQRWNLLVGPIKAGRRYSKISFTLEDAADSGDANPRQ